MPANDWIIFDLCFSTEDRFYWFVTRRILEERGAWGRTYGQGLEEATQALFKFSFIEGLGRKRVLGVRRPANRARAAKS